MDKKRSKKSRLRYDSAIRIMYELEQEPAHILQVKNLALQLFDQLKPLHGYGNTERDMLEAAAILHDIGYVQGKKQHHKNSLSIIEKSSLEGWNDRQKLVIGNIARYHSRKLPRKKHINYARLIAWDRLRVLKLAALLRLADGLDRSHSDAIKTLKCKIDLKTVKLKIKARGEIPLEIQGFKKKRDLFILAYSRDIVIEDIKNIWYIEPHHFTEPMELI